MAHIDHSPIAGTIKEIVKSIDFCERTWRVQKIRQGCNRAIYNCLSWGFDELKENFGILIEDDLTPAKDSLFYFEQCQKKFEKDDKIFSIDAFNLIQNWNEVEEKDEYKIIKQNSYRPWFWSTWKNRWRAIREKWKFSERGISWDLHLKKKLKGDLMRVYPKIPRVKNLGFFGEHTKNKEWHNRRRLTKIWSNDFNLDLKQELVLKQKNYHLQI